MRNVLLFPLALLIASCAPVVLQPISQPVLNTSAWGGVSNGLQGRIEAPLEVEQNAVLPITLELKCVPELLPRGVTRLEPDVYQERYELEMVNVATGKEFKIEPFAYDGPPIQLSPDSFTALDGSAIESDVFPTSFPLRLAGPELRPGDYVCTVSYSTARSSHEPGHASAASWSGEVVSAPLHVKVIPEVVRKEIILVPTRLTEDADGQIRFHSLDSEPLEINVANGLKVCTSIESPEGGSHLTDSPPADPDTVDDFGPIADVSRLPAGKTLTYTIDVFTTTELRRNSQTGPRTSIWKKTLSVVTVNPRPIATSPWSPAARGLQVRAQIPGEVEQNAEIPVTLELKCEPGLLPNGISRFDTGSSSTRYQLRMVNRASGKEYTIEPYDYGGPQPMFDDGRYFDPLDGTPLHPLMLRFELLAAAPDLPTGDYQCTVSYSDIRKKDERPRSNEVTFWSGELVSAPVHIEVIPKTSRTEKILVPTRLFVDSDGMIRMHSEYSQPVNVTVESGMSIETVVAGNGNGDEFMVGGGPPDMRLDSQITMANQMPSGKKVQLTIEVVETGPYPDKSFWGDPHWIVWKKTFSVAIPK